MKGKHFTTLWGLHRSQRCLRRSIPPFPWILVFLLCPGADLSLLMVRLKSKEELGVWSPWKLPNAHESRQAYGLETSLLFSQSRESLEVIAGGHGGSGGGWTEMIPCLGRKVDPPSSPKSLISTHLGTCTLHGKG